MHSEYMLWTDATAREFIAEYYPWFLDTFDGYTYPIQRADVIRYFVLYHYGGIYIDLDIGCLRPLDSLLSYPVILPKTIPVGVSNDLMFAEKRHQFMEQTIRNLISFDHSWVLNYPTVMFSTGPMFLSAQYGLWTASHPVTPDMPGGEVRILPKSLYGKNTKPEEAIHSFFSHYYGSSWHADDAAFFGFLGAWGKGVMWIGLLVLVFGIVRMALVPSAKPRNLRRIGGYEVMMPRWIQMNGRWHLDLGWFTVPASGITTQPTSPVTLPSEDPASDDDELPLLPVSISRTSSTGPSDSSSTTFMNGMSTSHAHANRPMFDVVRRHVISSLWGSQESPEEVPMTPRRARPRRGVLFFLPAIFSPAHDGDTASSRLAAQPQPHHDIEDPDKRRYAAELEEAGLLSIRTFPTRTRTPSASSSGSSSPVC